MNITEIRRHIRVNKLRAKRATDPTRTIFVLSLITYFLPLAIYLYFSN